MFKRKIIEILFVINVVFINIIIYVINIFLYFCLCNINLRYIFEKIDFIYLILNRCIMKLKDYYWFVELFVVKFLFLLYVFCNDMVVLIDRVYFYGDIFILNKL